MFFIIFPCGACIFSHLADLARALVLTLAVCGRALPANLGRVRCRSPFFFWGGGVVGGEGHTRSREPPLWLRASGLDLGSLLTLGACIVAPISFFCGLKRSIEETISFTPGFYCFSSE